MAWGETGLSILLRTLNLLVLSYYPLLHVAPYQQCLAFLYHSFSGSPGFRASQYGLGNVG